MSRRGPARRTARGRPWPPTPRPPASARRATGAPPAAVLPPTAPLIADSGALYALYDADDLFHEAVRVVVAGHRGPVVVPAVLLAEVDYLLREFLGVDAELDFLRSLESGAFALEPFIGADLARCRELVARYRDLDLGLTDAGVVATAERLRTRHLLTVDERDFRAVVPAGGQPFVILPADAV